MYLCIAIEKNTSQSVAKGQIPEWPNGADCKSAGLRLRWFESIFAHLNCGSSSVDRALAFQAEGRGFEPRLPLSRRGFFSESSFFCFHDSCCPNSQNTPNAKVSCIELPGVLCLSYGCFPVNALRVDGSRQSTVLTHAPTRTGSK